MLTEQIIEKRHLKNRQKSNYVASLISGVDRNQAVMASLKSEKIVTIRPNTATEWLAQLNGFLGQRDLNQTKLKEFSEKILDGRFFTSKIDFATLEGRRYIVNGQHTLTACQITAHPVKALVSEWECDNEKQLSVLWSQFDSGAVRTPRQMANAFLSVYGTDWHPGLLTLAASGCAISAYGPTQWHVRTTREERFLLIEQRLKESTATRDLIVDGEDTKHLRRAVVVSAVMDAFREDEKAAGEFWVKVRDGLDQNDRNDPSKRLRDFLLSNNVNGQKTAVTMLNRCRLAWSNHLQGSGLTAQEFNKA